MSAATYQALLALAECNWLDEDPTNSDELAAAKALARAALIPAQDEDEAQYLAYAQEHYQSDGDLEFDDNADVSMGGDPGAYVACWKWVRARDAGVATDGDEGDDE